MTAADSYMRDAPLTQALAAALAIPNAKTAASERDEFALLKAKDNAFMRVSGSGVCAIRAGGGAHPDTRLAEA